MNLHRRAAIEQAAVLLFKASPEPKLGSPVRRVTGQAP